MIATTTDTYHDSEACSDCRPCPNCDGIEQADDCPDHQAFDCGAEDEILDDIDTVLTEQVTEQEERQ